MIGVMLHNASLRFSAVVTRNTRRRPSELAIALLLSEVESNAVMAGVVTEANLPQAPKNSRRSSSSEDDIVRLSFVNIEYWSMAELSSSITKCNQTPSGNRSPDGLPMAQTINCDLNAV